MLDENEDEGGSDYMIVKAVLIGGIGVGKTSIIKKFTTNTFDPNSPPSISSNFAYKTINISNKNKPIKFELWDTAGQEKYHSLAKFYYKDARVIIFVYDIINKDSFLCLQEYWYKQIKSNCLPNAIFALVGNKSDLYYEEEVIENQEAMKWADEIGAIFQTTSAKSNSGIDLLFQNIGKKLLDNDFDYKNEEEKNKQLYEMKKKNEKEKKKKDIYEADSDFSESRSVKLDKRSHKKRKKKNCC